MVVYESGYYTIDEDGINSLEYFLRKKAKGQTVYILVTDEKPEVNYGN